MIILIKLMQMDPRVKEVIEGAVNSSNNELRSLEPFIDQKMASVLDTCYSKNSSNADRFAECILEKNRKVDDIMKSVEFKLLFFSKNANACLLKRSVGECTQEAIKGIQEMIENTKRSIDKL